MKLVASTSGCIVKVSCDGPSYSMFVISNDGCMLSDSLHCPSCSMLVMPNEMVADCVTHIGVPPAS